MVGAAYTDEVSFCTEVDHMLGACLNTGRAANALILINRSNSMTVYMDGTKTADVNTLAAADTARGAACIPAASVTGDIGLFRWEPCHYFFLLLYGVPSRGRLYLRMPS